MVSMNFDHVDVPGPTSQTRDNLELKRRLMLVVRCLPLVTLAAWVITTVVPILDSDEGSGPRLTITSMGEAPINFADLNPGVILGWAAVLVLAVLAWVLKGLKWWSVAAIIVGDLLVLTLGILAVDPPSLVWDGQTAEGMPAGGMVIARPAIGYYISIVGSCALVAAGLFGFMLNRRQTR